MKKSAGIVREVDQLGRVVLPSELRSLMGIEKRDPLEIFVDEEAKNIILKKYHFNCLFCRNSEGLINIKGKYVCPACLEEIKKLD